MDILKGLADNPSLLEATKAFLLEKFSINKICFSKDADAAFIGNYVRTRQDAQEILESAFIEIASYKTVKEAPDKPHPGR